MPSLSPKQGEVYTTKDGQTVLVLQRTVLNEIFKTVIVAPIFKGENQTQLLLTERVGEKFASLHKLFTIPIEELNEKITEMHPKFFKRTPHKLSRIF